MATDKHPQKEQTLKTILKQLQNNPKDGAQAKLTDAQAKQLALHIKKLLRQHLN